MTWKTVFRAWHRASVEAKHYSSEACVKASYTPTPEFLAVRDRADRRRRQRAMFWGWLAQHAELPGA